MGQRNGNVRVCCCFVITFVEYIVAVVLVWSCLWICLFVCVKMSSLRSYIYIYIYIYFTNGHWEFFFPGWIIPFTIRYGLSVILSGRSFRSAEQIQRCHLHRLLAGHLLRA